MGRPFFIVAIKQSSSAARDNLLLTILAIGMDLPSYISLDRLAEFKGLNAAHEYTVKSISYRHVGRVRVRQVHPC